MLKKIVIICLTACIVLCSCSNNSNNANVNNNSKKENDVTKNENTATKKKIKYWSIDEPSFVEANKAVIENFKNSHPDVEVEYNYFEYDSYRNKLKVAYLEKNGPDVHQIFGSWTKYFAKNGYIFEMSKELLDAKEFYEVPLIGYTYNNKIYGIPREYNIESCGVLYHPKKLSKLGYNKFPENYKEMIELAKKLTVADEKGNLTNLGFDFMTMDNATFLFLSFILQRGGSFWNGKHINFATIEAENALSEMIDLVNKHKVTDIMHYITTKGYNDGCREYLSQNKISICYLGPWNAAVNSNSDTSYTRMPSYGINNAFAAESGWGEVLSTNSQNKELALEFLKYITNDENYKLFNKKTNTIPAKKTVARSKDFIENAFLSPLIGILDEGKFIGDIPDADAFKLEFMKHFAKVSNGEETIKVALKTLEEGINKMIDKDSE